MSPKLQLGLEGHESKLVAPTISLLSPVATRAPTAETKVCDMTMPLDDERESSAHCPSIRVHNVRFVVTKTARTVILGPAVESLPTVFARHDDT